jgi:hypothetical protein
MLLTVEKVAEFIIGKNIRRFSEQEYNLYGTNLSRLKLAVNATRTSVKISNSIINLVLFFIRHGLCSANEYKTFIDVLRISNKQHKELVIYEAFKKSVWMCYKPYAEPGDAIIKNYLQELEEGLY